MASEKQITLLDFFKILNADLASLFLDYICPKRCKSHDKSLKFRRLRRDIKAAAFLTWLADFKKILTSTGATSFWD